MSDPRCPRCGYEVWCCGCATHEEHWTPERRAQERRKSMTIAEIESIQEVVRFARDVFTPMLQISRHDPKVVAFGDEIDAALRVMGREYSATMIAEAKAYATAQKENGK